jgi:hypothetical protein
MNGLGNFSLVRFKMYSNQSKFERNMRNNKNKSSLPITKKSEEN